MSQIWKFLQELRQRRVFRVAGIYAVAGWTSIQVADDALIPIGMPVWMITVLVWLIIAGFPIALILGWRYQLTRDGVIRSHGTNTADTNLKLNTIDYVVFVALATIVCVIALGLIRQVAEPPSTKYATEFPAGSIAVLPFEDLSAERDQRHLAEGMADTLIHRLGQYPHLRVIARTSSFAFQERNIDLRQIAQSLNSSTILEGSLLKAGDLFRVTVRLIDGRSGQQILSEEFSRNADEFFLLMDEVAALVARLPQLKPPAQLVRFDSTSAISFESYELYVLGRHQWHKRTADSLHTAIRYFQQAISQDPTYALAWTGLADSYSLLVQHMNLPLDNVYDEAKKAIDEALALNPNLAEAHASQGLLAYLARDFPAADSSLERAIELNSNYAMSYVWLGRSLFFRERFAEAMVQYKKAVELDPQAPITKLNVALTNVSLGNIDEAKNIYLDIIALDPAFPNAYWGLGFAHWVQGDADWSVARLLHGIDIGLESLDSLLILSSAYIDLGRFDEANKFLDQAVMLADGETFNSSETRLYLYQVSGRVDEYAALALKYLRLDTSNPFAIERVAFARTLQGRFDEALEHYERANALAVSTNWQTHPWSHFWGRMPLVDWAHAALETGNDKAAEQKMERMMRLWKSNEVNGVFNVPVYRYMEACILSLRGEHKEALLALRDAYDHGWRRYRWARLDPKLKLLHDDVEFISLMKEIEKSVVAQNQNLDRLTKKEVIAILMTGDFLMSKSLAIW